MLELAIDRRYHGQGWGGFLFLDALYRYSRSEVASFAVMRSRGCRHLAPDHHRCRSARGPHTDGPPELTSLKLISHRSDVSF